MLGSLTGWRQINNTKIPENGMRLIYIILIGFMLGCSDKESASCDCTVEYQTTKSGKGWRTESTRTRKEDHDGNCDEGDRTDVIVMPIITGAGSNTVWSRDGIREVVDCE